MILSCLGASPFLTVVMRKVDVSALVACNSMCSFIRFFSSPDRPASSVGNLILSLGSSAAIEHLQVDMNSTSDVEELNFFQRGLPLIVSAWNGHDLQASAPQLSIASFPAATLFGLAEWSSALAMKMESPSPLPSSKNVPEGYCEDPDTREEIPNFLDDCYSPVIYLWGIILWTSLKILHDWAMLCGFREGFTLWIGLASWLCQATACVSAFLWAASSMDVFTADIGNGSACYYQLGGLDRALAVGLAFLLLMTTESKLQNLELSILHGDSLHGILHPVLSTGLAQTKAPVTLMGEPNESDPDVLVLFGRVLYAVSNMWTLIQYLIIDTFVIGPLSVQLTFLASAADPSLARQALMALVLLSGPGLGIFVLLVILSRFWQSGFNLRENFPGKEIGLIFGLASIFSTIQVIPLWQRREELQESWAWFFHGTTVYLLIVWLSPRFQAPVEMPLEVRRLAPRGHAGESLVSGWNLAWRGLQMFEQGDKESHAHLAKQLLKTGGYSRVATPTSWECQEHGGAVVIFPRTW